MLDFLKDILNESTLIPSIKSVLFVGIQIVDCLLVIAFGLFSSFIFRKMIFKFFSNKKSDNQNYETVITVLSSIVKYSVYFFIFFQILTIFGVSVESIIAVAGVGSIAVGFGAKSIVEDIVTGVSILIEEQFKVGDTVLIGNNSGTVESIGLRTTRIRSYDGDVHIFPNSSIKIVTNMSKEFNRAVIEIPISYECEIEKTLQVINDEMAKSFELLDGLISKPNVQGITKMEPTYLIIRVIADCKIGENWAVERELRRLVKIRFEKEKINPPYPHQFFHKAEN